MRYSFRETDKPLPVTGYDAACNSPFLIVIDHASSAIFRSLREFGVPETECRRHIASDIGVAVVSRLVAAALNAAVIQQNYSRLVTDCNRKPRFETSIPVIFELTLRPGNIGLNESKTVHTYM